MINSQNFKIYKYSDLKLLLPKGNSFDLLYEKSKDKEKFDQELICVYVGDIEVEILNIYVDIKWGIRNHFDAITFYPPVILGNVTCKLLDLFEGIIIGNVSTQNMNIIYPENSKSFSQIHGNLNVKEMLYAEGKGVLGSKFNFLVSQNVQIITFVNYHQVTIKCNSLIIKTEFDFPQTYETEDKSKDTPTTTDWSKYSLELLTNHFNPQFIDVNEFGNYDVSFFFGGSAKMSKFYNNYIK